VAPGTSPAYWRLEVGQAALGRRQFLIVLGDLLRQELLRLLGASWLLPIALARKSLSS